MNSKLIKANMIHMIHKFKIIGCLVIFQVCFLHNFLDFIFENLEEIHEGTENISISTKNYNEIRFQHPNMRKK